ncbi:MAG: carbon-nitrogen hydrolase family protein [Aquificae bacterium]|nr:carbon-nitrogen hydrolase family protein [Aquificota bacterium]
MKLYALQFRLESPPENEKKVFEALSRAEPGSLVLLPELWHGGVSPEAVRSLAHLTPELLRKLRAVSRKKGLLVAGTLPLKREGKLYNAAFVLDRGRLAGLRGKRKLFPLFGETELFSPGKERLVFNTSFGKVGLLICFELRFPELVAEVKREAPEFLLVPAQWGYARREHLRVLSRSRAIELQAYALVANAWGEHAGTRFAGSSGIYSPWGEALAYAEKGDALLEAVYEPEELRRVRRELPVY